MLRLFSKWHLLVTEEIDNTAISQLIYNLCLHHKLKIFYNSNNSKSCYVRNWDMPPTTPIKIDSEFREKWVYHIMKIGYVLSQVTIHSHWNYRNVNKLNWTPAAILNNKLPGISSMCYGIIINWFKWFWKVQSYIPARMKNFSCIVLQIKIVMVWHLALVELQGK